MCQVCLLNEVPLSRGGFRLGVYVPLCVLLAYAPLLSISNRCWENLLSTPVVSPISTTYLVVTAGYTIIGVPGRTTTTTIRSCVVLQFFSKVGPSHGLVGATAFVAVRAPLQESRALACQVCLLNEVPLSRGGVCASASLYRCVCY